MAKGVGAKPTYVWAPADWLAEKNVNGWSDLPVWIPESEPGMEGFSRVDVSKAINAGLKFRPLEETVTDVSKAYLVDRAGQ